MPALTNLDCLERETLPQASMEAHLEYLCCTKQAQARKEMLRRDALVNRLAERRKALESVKTERKQQDCERRELSTEVNECAPEKTCL